jgi:Smg protein
MTWKFRSTGVAGDHGHGRRGTVADGGLDRHARYVDEEHDALGSQAIGFIQFLESAKVLSPLQREIVIERALSLGETPIALAKLKVIVLMLLWSQGKEPDALMFDDLFASDEDQAPRLLH